MLYLLAEKARALCRLLAEHLIACHQVLPQVEADQINQALPSLREAKELRCAPNIATSTATVFELASWGLFASFQMCSSGLLIGQQL